MLICRKKEKKMTEISDVLLGCLVNSCKECDIIEYYKKPWTNEKLYKLDIQKLSAIFSEMQKKTKLKSFKFSSPVRYGKKR